MRLWDEEVRIGVGMILCLFVTWFFPGVQRLAACTAVVMCTQGGERVTAKAALIRLEGVLCGGGIGIAVVLLDNRVGVDFAFFLFCGIGIFLNLLLCNGIHMPKVTGRVSAITFCLVVLLAEGNGRIYYAGSRFVGTLVGGCIALALAAVWDVFDKEKAMGKG